MVVLITGASHTGKTLLAQKLLEKHHYPYLSMDHLKMGLIRSGQTNLTPEDDDELTEYLWPIVREIIKTAIENGQNLIVEGCYVPRGWAAGFGENYLAQILCYCLVMTERYIQDHFEGIRDHANAIERRLDDASCTLEGVLADNARFAELGREREARCVLIDGEYEVEVDLDTPVSDCDEGGLAQGGQEAATGAFTDEDAQSALGSAPASKQAGTSRT